MNGAECGGCQVWWGWYWAVSRVGCVLLVRGVSVCRVYGVYRVCPVCTVCQVCGL